MDIGNLAGARKTPSSHVLLGEEAAGADGRHRKK